jgi:hypothetical protein
MIVTLLPLVLAFVLALLWLVTTTYPGCTVCCAPTTIHACTCNFPLTMHLTVTGAAGCTCVNGTYALTWNPTYTGGGLVPFGAWVSAPMMTRAFYMCGSPTPTNFVLFDNGSGQCELYLLNNSFQGCGFFVTVSSCSPINLTAGGYIPSTCLGFLGWGLCSSTSHVSFTVTA